LSRHLRNQGYAEAQSILGVMYANGKGVLKDLSKAKYWIKKAYEGGDSKAKKKSTLIGFAY
jgi:TPR repeat protein